MGYLQRKDSFVFFEHGVYLQDVKFSEKMVMGHISENIHIREKKQKQGLV